MLAFLSWVPGGRAVEGGLNRGVETKRSLLAVADGGRFEKTKRRGVGVWGGGLIVERGSGSSREGRDRWE